MKKIQFVGIEVPENKNLVITDMESGVLFTFEDKKDFVYGIDLGSGFDYTTSTTLNTFGDDEIEYIDFNDYNIHPDIVIGTSFKIKGSETIYRINNVDYKNVEISFLSSTSHEAFFINRKLNHVNEKFKNGEWHKIDDESVKQILNVPIGTRFRYQHNYNTLIGEIINTTNEKKIIVEWDDTNTPQYTSYSIEEVDIFFKNKIWIKI